MNWATCASATAKDSMPGRMERVSWPCFSHALYPMGLYLLDEPEVPLSPIRQMALIAAINEMVSQSDSLSLPPIRPS